MLVLAWSDLVIKVLPYPFNVYALLIAANTRSFILAEHRWGACGSLAATVAYADEPITLSTAWSQVHPKVFLD